MSDLVVKNESIKQELNLKFIDLFAGIGGFHLALHNQGAKCVFAAEINSKCRETYKNNFNTISPEIFQKDLFAKDITFVDPSSIPEHNILCAGFPCQPFSISGAKKGFEDTRGTLFFNVLKIAEVKKPSVIFLENVKHLVHHNNGHTLQVIIDKLEDLGYFVEWKVLNAKDFGLAQNRERIIIIASKKSYFDFGKVQETRSAIIKDILDNDNFGYLSQEEYTLLPANLVKQQKSGLIFCGYRNKTIRKSGVKPNTAHLSRAHKQPNRIYHINGTHPTLPSQETSGRFFIFDGNGVRKLTIDECYKLQGFPKHFIKNNTLSACYNQIGNSVAIPMIEAVYKQIKKQFFTD